MVDIRYYIKKIKWGQQESLPMMQGMAIKDVIKEYKMPAIAWGYYADVIGVETKQQTILWKDYGSHLEFLGLLNKDKDEIKLPASKKEKEEKQVDNYQELLKEIKKRDYNNIKGLTAKVTKEGYDYALNVLPPLKMDGDTFYMSEFLSGELTMKYFKKGNVHYCKVVDFWEEFPKIEEEEYLKMRY